MHHTRLRAEARHIGHRQLSLSKNQNQLPFRIYLLQLDELSRMCGVLGPFTADSWPEGHKLLSKLGFSLQAVEQQPLSQQALHASAEALDLMTSLCCWDPAKRPTASQALRHSFFKVRSQLELSRKLEFGSLNSLARHDRVWGGNSSKVANLQVFARYRRGSGPQAGITSLQVGLPAVLEWLQDIGK